MRLVGGRAGAEGDLTTGQILPGGEEARRGGGEDMEGSRFIETGPAQNPTPYTNAEGGGRTRGGARTEWGRWTAQWTTKVSSPPYWGGGVITFTPHKDNCVEASLCGGK